MSSDSSSSLGPAPTPPRAGSPSNPSIGDDHPMTDPPLTQSTIGNSQPDLVMGNTTDTNQSLIQSILFQPSTTAFTPFDPTSPPFQRLVAVLGNRGLIDVNELLHNIASGMYQEHEAYTMIYELRTFAIRTGNYADTLALTLDDWLNQHNYNNNDQLRSDLTEIQQMAQRVRTTRNNLHSRRQAIVTDNWTTQTFLDSVVAPLVNNSSGCYDELRQQVRLSLYSPLEFMLRAQYYCIVRLQTIRPNAIATARKYITPADIRRVEDNTYRPQYNQQRNTPLFQATLTRFQLQPDPFGFYWINGHPPPGAHEACQNSGQILQLTHDGLQSQNNPIVPIPASTALTTSNAPLANWFPNTAVPTQALANLSTGDSPDGAQPIETGSTGDGSTAQSVSSTSSSPRARLPRNQSSGRITQLSDSPSPPPTTSTSINPANPPLINPPPVGAAPAATSAIPDDHTVRSSTTSSDQSDDSTTNADHDPSPTTDVPTTLPHPPPASGQDNVEMLDHPEQPFSSDSATATTSAPIAPVVPATQAQLAVLQPALSNSGPIAQTTHEDIPFPRPTTLEETVWAILRALVHASLDTNLDHVIPHQQQVILMRHTPDLVCAAACRIYHALYPACPIPPQYTSEAVAIRAAVLTIRMLVTNPQFIPSTQGSVDPLRQIVSQWPLNSAGNPQLFAVRTGNELLQGCRIRKSDFESLLYDPQYHNGWLTGTFIFSGLLLEASRQNDAIDQPDTSRWHILPDNPWTSFENSRPFDPRYLPSRPHNLLVVIYGTNHWSLLIFHYDTRSLIYLDSHEAPQDRAQYFDLADRFLQLPLLQQVYGPGTWRRTTTRSNRQANGFDCGMWTIQNGRSMMRNMTPAPSVTLDQRSTLAQEVWDHTQTNPDRVVVRPPRIDTGAPGTLPTGTIPPQIASDVTVISSDEESGTDDMTDIL